MQNWRFTWDSSFLDLIHSHLTHGMGWESHGIGYLSHLTAEPWFTANSINNPNKSDFYESLFVHWSSKFSFHACFAAVELVDNVENQPWFQHSSERAQKLQLKKIKESIRAITRSKTVSSGKKVKSGNYKFMSEKEARRIRKPRKKLGNRFGNGNGNDGYFWVRISFCWV